MRLKEHTSILTFRWHQCNIRTRLNTLITWLVTNKYKYMPNDDLILAISAWDLFGSSVIYGKVRGKLFNYSLRANSNSSRFFLVTRIILLRSYRWEKRLWIFSSPFYVKLWRNPFPTRKSPEFYRSCFKLCRLKISAKIC